MVHLDPCSSLIYPLEMGIWLIYLLKIMICPSFEKLVYQVLSAHVRCCFLYHPPGSLAVPTEPCTVGRFVGGFPVHQLWLLGSRWFPLSGRDFYGISMGLSGDDSRFLIGSRMGDYLEFMWNWDDNGNSMKTIYVEFVWKWYGIQRWNQIWKIQLDQGSSIAGWRSLKCCLENDISVESDLLDSSVHVFAILMGM